MSSLFRKATLSFVTASCLAQSPWNGTWKVNQVESTLKPTPFALEQAGDKYTLHYGDVYSFTCADRQYPTNMALTLRCQGGAKMMALTLSIPGHWIWRWTVRPSPDGRAMEAVVSHNRIGKAPSIERDSYVRLSGSGASLIGAWMGVKMLLVTPDIAVLRVHDDSLYYLDTWDGNVADAKLDGTPTRWLDPHLPKDQWTNKLVSPRRIVGHELVAGKPVNKETLEIAPDGRTIKLWLGDDESQYQILDKQ